jgi:CII-binding regulator of phage lambda lysogenization HflD
MAEKILYRIEIDGKNATAKIIDLTNGFKKTDVAVENLNETLGKMNGEMVRTTSSIGRQMDSLKKQRSQVQINGREYQNLTKSMRFYQSQMDMSTGATGSASSAAMELGRVMSDAPYGIRGVANNISQFASQMAFAAKSTGSLTLAFKDLWKALMGPLGILLAIQGVIAIVEKMSMSKKKAKEDSEKLTSALERQRKELRELTKGYDELNKVKEKVIQTSSKEREKMKALVAATLDSTNSDERKQRALSQLIKLYPKYFKNLKIGELKNLYDAEEKVDRILQRKLKLKHQLERAEEIANEIQIEKIKIEKDSKNADLDKIGRLRAEQKEVRELIQVYLASDMQLKLDEDKDNDSGKTKKISPFATPKELEIDIKNAENAIIKYEKQIEDARLKKELNDKLSEATTEEDKKKIREQYQLDRLKNQLNAEKKVLDLKLATEKKVVNTKRDNHIADLKRATELYIHKVKLNDKLSDKEKEQMIGIAKSQLQIATNQANTEADGAITEIKDKYQTLFGFFEQLGIARKDALISGFGANKEGGKKDDRESDLEFGIQEYMKLQSGLTDFLNGEYDRQLTIEQNKTNAMNNQLRERLNNENLSAGERKNIQLQIAKNDEELRKKQEKIEKKRFKLNKAANIANALINTYLASQKAFASQIIVGDPTSLPRALLAKKLAIVSGLLNVAAIARQKFQSSAGAAPTAGALGGGSGGGDNTREFNFNLAGSTQSNQLTQSIAGQLSQPIQTYVVSSEITSQQQLDLNIANTATIGG